MNSNSSKKAWTNFASLILTFIINTLGALGFINGLSQKAISDRYSTLITPSPSTFSIWSIIYLLLLLSAAVMILKKNDPYYQRAIDEITGLFRLSCLLNIGWIVTFSYLLVEISTVLIFAFVITLALLCGKLLKINEDSRFLLPQTFGLYTGWLIIASVVNTAAALVKVEWDRFGISETIWAAAILIIAVVIVLFIMLSLHNAVLPLPVAWAYWGIYQVRGEGFSLLTAAALIGMVLLILFAAMQFYFNRFAILPRHAKN